MIGRAVGGKDISAVVIDTHAGPKELYFGDIDHDKKDDKNENLYTNQIASLGNKNIDNLILLGCNAGHLDYKYTNVAAAFSKKTNGGYVMASDGTVGDEFFGCYLSADDDTFQDYCNRRRYNEDCTAYNEGWIIYQNINNKVHINNTGLYNISIKQMLNAMK